MFIDGKKRPEVLQSLQQLCEKFAPYSDEQRTELYRKIWGPMWPDRTILRNENETREVVIQWQK